MGCIYLQPTHADKLQAGGILVAYLEMKGITKCFPGVIANDSVDLSVEKGSIHALLGENGAGKSTLMRVLYGIYTPDAGKILLENREKRIQNPQVAINLGIGMVHQEFQLVPSLTVAENIALGHEPMRGVWVDRKKEKSEIAAIAEKFGFEIALDTTVSKLSVGAQQQVEIIKLLYRQAQLLILDEPTAVLTPQEVESLFGVLENLRKEGRTIIYITHKLREVKAICQKATILRRGKLAGCVPVSTTGERELANLMVGHSIIDQSYPRSKSLGDERLSLENLEALDDRNVPALRGLSLTVRAGEIVGLAGVQGNGQSELVEVIAGLREATGKINISGRDIGKQSLRKRREAGLAIIPEKRKEQGLNLNADIAENVIASRYYHKPFVQWGIVNRNIALDFGAALIKRFGIKADSPMALVKTLSGGNQQKVITGRELTDAPDILIAAYPTRGLDIAAAQSVREELIKRRDNGGAVLLISADLDEIFAVSDRIAVIYEGSIIGEKAPDQTTYEEIGLFMAGHNEK